MNSVELIKAIFIIMYFNKQYARERPIPHYSCFGVTRGFYSNFKPYVRKIIIYKGMNLWPKAKKILLLINNCSVCKAKEIRMASSVQTNDTLGYWVIVFLLCVWKRERRGKKLGISIEHAPRYHVRRVNPGTPRFMKHDKTRSFAVNV